MNSWYKYINDYGTIESISTTKTEKNKNLETMWTNHTSTKSWKNSLINMISKIKKSIMIHIQGGHCNWLHDWVWLLLNCCFHRSKWRTLISAVQSLLVFPNSQQGLLWNPSQLAGKFLVKTVYLSIIDGCHDIFCPGK